MDLGVKKHKICFRTGAATSAESVKGENGKVATVAEKKSLLGSEEKGTAVAGKRKKRLTRKVQWNDRKGNDLVEVLEFEPRELKEMKELFTLASSLMRKLSSLLLPRRVAEGEENFLTEWPCYAIGPEQKKRDKKTEDKPDTIPPNSGFGAWRKNVAWRPLSNI